MSRTRRVVLAAVAAAALVAALAPQALALDNAPGSPCGKGGVRNDDGTCGYGSGVSGDGGPGPTPWSPRGGNIGGGGYQPPGGGGHTPAGNGQSDSLDNKGQKFGKKPPNNKPPKQDAAAATPPPPTPPPPSCASDVVRERYSVDDSEWSGWRGLVFSGGALEQQMTEFMNRTCWNAKWRCEISPVVPPGSKGGAFVFWMTCSRKP